MISELCKSCKTPCKFKAGFVEITKCSKNKGDDKE